MRETAEYNTELGSQVHYRNMYLSEALDRINNKFFVSKLFHNTLSKQVVDVVAYINRNTFMNGSFTDVQNDPWLI